MNPDYLIKVKKEGGGHPAAPPGVDSKVCPQCLGPIFSHGPGDPIDEEPLFNSFCANCMAKVRSELTFRQKVESTWAPCQSCGHLLRINRAQYCMACYLKISQEYGGGPNPEVLESNKDYQPLTHDAYIESEMWRLADINYLKKGWDQASCHVCHYFLKLNGSDHCMACFLSAAKFFGIEPNPAILEANKNYQPLTFSQWVDSELMRAA